MAQEIKKAEARHEILSGACSIVYQGMRRWIFRKADARSQRTRLTSSRLSLNLCDAVIEDEGDELAKGLEAIRAYGLFRSETLRPAAGSDARFARFEPGRRLGILGAASRVRHAA